MINSFFEKLGYAALRRLDPETAHSIGKRYMAKQYFAPGKYSKEPCWLGSVNLLNPLGLAAGFDKNGELINSFSEYGFGFMEVGSVTLHGGKGNPRPRLFRTENGDLLNRMGLNGDSAHTVKQRLSGSTQFHYGVSIAKTHDPSIVGDAAIRDIIGSYELLRWFGMYTVINISCPNTKEGKTFETNPDSLRDLLSEIKRIRGEKMSVPMLMVKISPTLPLQPHDLDKVLDHCHDYGVKGFIVGNTLLSDHPKYGRGGMSGRTSGSFARSSILMIRPRTDKLIVACGGIFNGSDMWDYREAGADLFQAYNGFVVGPNAGPRFAHKVLDRYYELRGK